MDVTNVFSADIEAELPYGLEEGKDLDVSDGAADLGDHHVYVGPSEPGNPAFDLVGDVGNDLDGLSQVVTPAFGGQDCGVDRSRSGIGVAREVLIDEPFVVPQIEVCLSPIVGDKHLAVLERVHRPRVHIYVWIELLHRDL